MSVLFSNVTAVLMDDERTVLNNAFVSVEGTRITFVGTERPDGVFDQVIDGTDKVLMPGFVNARPDSNRRQSRWQRDALPTELHSLVLFQ